MVFPPLGRLTTRPGQPLCISRAAVAEMVAAGVLPPSPERTATIGCQTIPEDVEVELLQRFPSGFQFLRIVKVKVISHYQPEPSVQSRLAAKKII
jgi:hypothetical protein